MLVARLNFDKSISIPGISLFSDVHGMSKCEFEIRVCLSKKEREKMKKKENQQCKLPNYLKWFSFSHCRGVVYLGIVLQTNKKSCSFFTIFFFFFLPQNCAYEFFIFKNSIWVEYVRTYVRMYVGIWNSRVS